MKLVFCVVHGRDKARLSDDLVSSGFKFTVVGSSGGFLREGNATFLIGVEEEMIDQLKEVIARNCKLRDQTVNVMPFDANPGAGILPNPVSVPVGGAVAFVIPVDEFCRF